MHRMWGGSSPSSVSACSRVIQVTGFDASCILAIGGAPVALNANGYRTMTSKPRHGNGDPNAHGQRETCSNESDGARCLAQATQSVGLLG